MHSWNNSIFKTIFKNKNGFLRSGWTILIVMLLYYALLYFASFLVLTALIVILTATGDLNRAADYFSPLANWVNDACLPVAMLILTDVMMIIIPIIAWKCFIKRPLSEMGLHPFKSTKKECGAGMILGMVNCTPDFGKHPYVINGCSELFAAVWGPDNGVGTRSAVGFGSLPDNIPVEIEALFKLYE